MVVPTAPRLHPLFQILGNRSWQLGPVGVALVTVSALDELPLDRGNALDLLRSLLLDFISTFIDDIESSINSACIFRLSSIGCSHQILCLFPIHHK